MHYNNPSTAYITRIFSNSSVSIHLFFPLFPFSVSHLLLTVFNFFCLFLLLHHPSLLPQSPQYTLLPLAPTPPPLPECSLFPTRACLAPVLANSVPMAVPERPHCILSGSCWSSGLPRVPFLLMHWSGSSWLPDLKGFILHYHSLLLNLLSEGSLPHTGNALSAWAIGHKWLCPVLLTYSSIFIMRECRLMWSVRYVL